MSTPEHLDRYALIRDTFAKQVGRTLEGYAVFAVDSSGEVYEGGHCPGEAKDIRAMLRAMKATEKHLQRYLDKMPNF